MAPNTTPSAGRPAPGDRLQLEMARMGAQGKAVASLDGFTMLVPRGLPGEQTEVRVENVHPRYAVARPVAVTQPSPERIEPPCADFEKCGGCDWLHVTYPRQLAFKREVLNDQLTRIGKITPPTDWEITPSEMALGYRDKLEFTTVREEGRLAPGFHGLEGKTPVAITRCHLAPEAYSTLAHAALQALPKSLGTAATGKLPAITRLTVQSTVSQQGRDAEMPGLVLTLHCGSPATAKALEAEAAPFLEKLGAAVPELRAVALSIRERAGRRSRTVQRMLRGEPTLTKVVAGRRYQVPLGGFFQVNLPQAAKLVGRVREIFCEAFSGPLAARKAPLLLDLFCGAGMFSLPLAAEGFKVAGMELSGEAARAARASAKSWGLSNCSFEAGDLTRPGKLKGLVRRHGPPGGVLVNPPRAGLPATLTESLLEHQPPLLLYVSCGGGTFARDVARLAPHYELSALHGFDLFPHTHHLETLAVFTPRPTPPASTPD